MPATVARFSQLFIPTLKEAPADAQVASHKLLVRAGFIRRLGAGIVMGSYGIGVEMVAPGDVAARAAALVGAERGR